MKEQENNNEFYDEIYNESFMEEENDLNGVEMVYEEINDEEI